MVVGPKSNRNLPQDPPPPGVALTLHPLSDLDRRPCTPPVCDAVDFRTLHQAFGPYFASTPQKPVRVQSELSVYWVSVQCVCTQPLKFSVQTTPENIRVFQELLTGRFDVLCPGCMRTHRNGRR
ncbi:E7 early protein [Bos taurus papillomavirus 32]|nr:E7 early protein [Bos taurus papillomavirus 32]